MVLDRARLARCRNRACSGAARRPRRRGCRRRRGRTPSPAVLASAGSAVSTTISTMPPGPPRILAVAARIGAEFVALEEQRKAHLGDFEAAELDAARRLPLAGAGPAVAGRRGAAARPRLEEMPDERPAASRGSLPWIAMRKRRPQPAIARSGQAGASALMIASMISWPQWLVASVTGAPGLAHTTVPGRAIT